jgi:hypothetical protein
MSDTKELAPMTPGEAITERERGGRVVALATAPNPYSGIAVKPFPEKAQLILGRKITDDDIEVRPDDGILYLPGVRIRQRLNDAFGIGGWGIAPNGEPKVNGNQVFAPMRLYILGRFVSEAMGEGKWIETNRKSTFGTALESAKTDALGRCGKDIGIALELWDPKFTREWRAANTVQVRNPDPSRFGSAPRVWVRKDDPCIAKDSPRDSASEGAAPSPVVSEAARTAAKVLPTGGPITPEQITLIHVLKGQVGGLTEEAYRKTIAVYRKADGERCVGEDGKGTSKALSKDQASHYIGRLEDQIHKQGLRVDVRSDKTADDMGVVLAKPEASFDDLMQKAFQSDGEEREWLHSLFGAEFAKELDRKQTETALQLLICMSQGDDVYQTAVDQARERGLVR